MWREVATASTKSHGVCPVWSGCEKEEKADLNKTEVVWLMREFSSHVIFGECLVACRL